MWLPRRTVMKKSVICLVQNRNHAERVIKQLLQVGFTKWSISIVMPNRNTAVRLAHDYNVPFPIAAHSGDDVHKLLGGELGQLPDIGVVDIPSLGSCIAAGPILVALAATATNGVATGLRQTLRRMGLPEFEARRSDAKVKGGNLLISVHVDSVEDQKRAVVIFDAAYAVDVCTTCETINSAAAEPTHLHIGVDLESDLVEQPMYRRR
jgi:hypothetical protein